MEQWLIKHINGIKIARKITALPQLKCEYNIEMLFKEMKITYESQLRSLALSREVAGIERRKQVSSRNVLNS